MADVFSGPLIIKRGKHYAAHILKTPGLSNRVKSDYTHGGRGSIYSALIGLNDEVMQRRDGGKGDFGLLVLPATNQRARKKGRRKPSLEDFINPPQKTSITAATM